MSGSPSQEIVSVNDEDEAVVDEMQEVVHKYQIWEPTDDYDIFESVAYSHNWFSKTQVDGESCASCRSCEEEKNVAKASGKPPPKSKKKKKAILKTPQGTTKRKFLFSLTLISLHNL